MSSAGITGAFLAEKNRAYRDGYAARLRGEPLTAFAAGGTYVGPFAKEGWESGWMDADSGRPNLMAPSGPGAQKIPLWGFVAVLVALYTLASWLRG